MFARLFLVGLSLWYGINCGRLYSLRQHMDRRDKRLAVGLIVAQTGMLAWLVIGGVPL